MKRLLWPLAIVIVPACLGTAGLLLARAAPSAPAAPPGTTATVSPAASPSPAPSGTTTPSGSTPSGSTPSGRPRPAHTPRPRRRLAGPWAVVSAYYRDVSSHKYARAWALIGSGQVTGQTYQQFVAGYACTGAEQPTRLGRSGRLVQFNLTVVNSCTGASQYYTGTDTVRGGKIVAAAVIRTG